MSQPIVGMIEDLIKRSTTFQSNGITIIRIDFSDYTRKYG